MNCAKGRGYMKLSAESQDKLETEIQREIIEYLQLMNCLVYRNNTGAKKIGGRLVRFGEPGAPDIIAIVPPRGRYLGLEVKRGKKKLTTEQRYYQSRVRELGGVYERVTSVDDVKNLMECL